ncbi:MAG: tetratricopeptide repeat protein [Gemmatimonadales bacterium]
MTETASRPGSIAASAGAFVGTFALVLAAIAALFAIDTILAQTDRAASRAEARRLFDEGERLQAHGEMRDALARLRSAVAAERQNPVYQRGLAAALLAAERPGDAQTVLAERLQHDPTDAEASLIMARALAREGRTRQAIAFYHRAIFGEWSTAQRARRVDARFELVSLLAAEHVREELLAELLPLEAEAPSDPATRNRIAHLFLAAGSPSHAVAIFGDLVRQDRHDADAYAGLGEAELRLGSYRSARRALATALALRPGDQSIAARLELCDRVLALDPTQRGIGTSAQYGRSVALLELTVAAADSCTGPGRGPPQAALLDSARAALARPSPVGPSVDAAVDARMNLAVRIWQSRPSNCPTPPFARPAELVVAKLAD